MIAENPTIFLHLNENIYPDLASTLLSASKNGAIAPFLEAIERLTSQDEVVAPPATFKIFRHNPIKQQCCELRDHLHTVHKTFNQLAALQQAGGPAANEPLLEFCSTLYNIIQRNTAGIVIPGDWHTEPQQPQVLPTVLYEYKIIAQQLLFIIYELQENRYAPQLAYALPPTLLASTAASVEFTTLLQKLIIYATNIPRADILSALQRLQATAASIAGLSTHHLAVGAADGDACPHKIFNYYVKEKLNNNQLFQLLVYFMKREYYIEKLFAEINAPNPAPSPSTDAVKIQQLEHAINKAINLLKHDTTLFTAQDREYELDYYQQKMRLIHAIATKNGH